MKIYPFIGAYGALAFWAGVNNAVCKLDTLERSCITNKRIKANEAKARSALPAGSGMFLTHFCGAEIVKNMQPGTPYTILRASSTTAMAAGGIASLYAFFKLGEITIDYEQWRKYCFYR